MNSNIQPKAQNRAIGVPYIANNFNSSVTCLERDAMLTQHSVQQAHCSSLTAYKVIRCM